MANGESSTTWNFGFDSRREEGDRLFYYSSDGEEMSRKRFREVYPEVREMELLGSLSLIFSLELTEMPEALLPRLK